MQLFTSDASLVYLFVRSSDERLQYIHCQSQKSREAKHASSISPSGFDRHWWQQPQWSCSSHIFLAEAKEEIDAGGQDKHKKRVRTQSIRATEMDENLKKKLKTSLGAERSPAQKRERESKKKQSSPGDILSVVRKSLKLAHECNCSTEHSQNYTCSVLTLCSTTSCLYVTLALEWLAARQCER